MAGSAIPHPYAVLVIGAVKYILYSDDISRVAVIHERAVVLPVVLAFAERQDWLGEQVLWPRTLRVKVLFRLTQAFHGDDLLSATKAERVGLINHIMPPGDHAEDYPTYPSSNQRPTGAIRWTKLVCNKHLRDEANSAPDVSNAAENLTLFSEDHEEAALAFTEKMTPEFKGY